MSSVQGAFVEIAETIDEFEFAKLQDRTFGAEERELRKAGRRFEARQAMGSQWVARDRIETLRCRLPE